MKQQLYVARAAATAIAERQIDTAQLDGEVLREIAAYRDLSRLADRTPTWKRSRFLLDLAERLHIEPADVAILAAEQNPKTLMERTLHHCRQLNDALSRPTADQETLSHINRTAHQLRLTSTITEEHS